MKRTLSCSLVNSDKRNFRDSRQERGEGGAVFRRLDNVGHRNASLRCEGNYGGCAEKGAHLSCKILTRYESDSNGGNAGDSNSIFYG